MFNTNPYKKQFDKAQQVEKSSFKKDKIQISLEAMELLKSEQLSGNRLEKIKELKEKIETGQYEINSKEIARKMYEFYSK